MEKTIEEVKKELLDNVVVTVPGREPSGGQSCGIIDCSVKLYQDDLDVTICIGNFYNIRDNKAIAMTLMELAIDELIRD
jgi:hypothetical protein